MWRLLLTVSCLLVLSKALETVPDGHIENSEGVKSGGYMDRILNEVKTNEDYALKKRNYLSPSIRPLPPQDVKCIMSNDKYCSKEMMKMKRVLIQAAQENCVKCSMCQKEEAGKLIMRLMAHHPVAWKLFLTRYGTHRTALDLAMGRRGARSQFLSRASE